MAVITLPWRRVRQRRRNSWGCVGLLLVLAVACCGGQGLAAWQQYRAPQPSVQQLQRRFARQRAQFEQLLALTAEDAALERVTAVWTRPEGQLDAARWKAYRELFAALDLAGGVERRADGGLFFIAALRALGGHGASRGVAYLPAPPPTRVPDLDALPPDAPAGTYYQPLDGSWYLFVTPGIER